VAAKSKKRADRARIADELRDLVFLKAVLKRDDESIGSEPVHMRAKRLDRVPRLHGEQCSPERPVSLLGGKDRRGHGDVPVTGQRQAFCAHGLHMIAVRLDEADVVARLDERDAKNGADRARADDRIFGH